MWKTAVHLDQSVKVGIDPESAWALLSSPRAWSAWPRGTLLFNVSDPIRPSAEQGPEQGRLRFWLSEAGGRAHAVVLVVTAETPGRTMSLQAANGHATWALSVRPGRRGSVLRVDLTTTVDRPAKVDLESGARAELRQWLSALRDIADGRRPTADGMPARLREACLAPPPLEPVVDVTTSTTIDAPPDLVGRLYLCADVMRLVQPDSVLYGGPVPGTTADVQVGAMRYIVARRSDGVLAGRVSLIAASSPGSSVVRFVTMPFDERIYRLESAGAGTRLEICLRCPRKVEDTQAHRDRHAAQLTRLASRYKSAIESLAARHS